MRFDEYWDDDGDSGERPLAPNGRHTGEILDAKVKRLAFMQSDKCPDGASLVLTVGVPKAQALESIVPLNMRGKIEAICRAAGVPLPTKGRDWDEQLLVGRTVTVETLLAVSKSGKEYVRVEKWLPGPSQPLPESRAASPARSQSQKAHREFTANAQAQDDIPF